MGDGLKIAAAIGLILVVAVVVVGISGCCGFIGPWASIPGKINEGAATVVVSNFDPVRMQKVYENLQTLKTDIEKYKVIALTYDDKQQSLMKLYGANATAWPKDVRSEYADDDWAKTGALNNYNNLVSQYNGEMSKWNYAFCNIGPAPYGVQGYQPMPKGYREYKTSVEDIKQDFEV